MMTGQNKLGVNEKNYDLSLERPLCAVFLPKKIQTIYLQAYSPKEIGHPTSWS